MTVCTSLREEGFLTAELVQEFGTCTSEQFGALKARAMAQNNMVVSQAKDSTVSAFEKRQMKSSMSQVLRAMEHADRRLHSTEFQFTGDPIPAPQNVRSHTHAASTRNATVNVSSIHISDQTDTTVVLGEDCAGKHVHMQNLSGTTVLGHIRPASISITGGTSIALNVASDGPLMAQNVSHSVLLVRCHQLRLHGCTDCVVFAEVPSKRVILEQCRRIQIGSIRDSYLCDEALAVDDFDWPSNAPNPHYSNITGAGAEARNVADCMETESLLRIKNTYQMKDG